MIKNVWFITVLIWMIGYTTAVAANAISSNGQEMVALTIPVGQSNGVYASGYLYLGWFKPDLKTGNWRGNLKKYQMNPWGGVIDQNGRPVFNSQGVLLNSAQSYWSESVDGATVDLGGAGALLVNRRSRNLYTYVGGVEKDLTARINAFSISNKDNILLTELNVANDDERQAVINDIHGIGKEWVMADVFHSQPVVVPYDTNRNQQIDQEDDAIIYVGTNGGVMHAFLDSSGQELWGFIPPQQLGRLKRLSDDGKDHDFFLDGAPVAIGYGDNIAHRKALVFGERRGGSNYYVLDITEFDSPAWKYHIGDDILGENAEPLGQSWGRPQKVVIATESDTIAEVLLVPGGYDINQDEKKPKLRDKKGRAVFAVDVETGALSNFDFHYEGEGSDMTHCIVDLIGIDPDGDGIVDSIYAPDLGGNMFAFTDRNLDGVWRKVRLFNASSEKTHRKIFYAPDVIRISGDPDPDDDVKEDKVGEMIFFGTGDMAHMDEKEVLNRFYAVKNYWKENDFETITDAVDSLGDSDLHDATNNPILQAATLEDQQSATREVKKRMGWFIDLESSGEKMVSSPVVFNGAVYFTTYAPRTTEGGELDDDCQTENDSTVTGEARLYALDYRDGRAVHDDWSNVKEVDPATHEVIASGGKADRYRVIGSSIPSTPVISIHRGVAVLYVGSGEELLAIEPRHGVEMNMYYWREIKR